MQILFVEDDLGSRSTVTRKLQAANHVVAVFDNSMDAMNYLDCNEPDVVLTDYRLGDYPDGLMLAEHVRHRYPYCVIILISAYANFEEAVKAIHLNADDFIQKPITGQQLVERIYQAYTRRRVWLPQKEAPVEVIPNLKIERSRRTVEWYGQPLQLTPAEYQIVSLLTSKPGNILTFTALATAINKGHMASPEDARIVLKTHVKNLRRKLEREGSSSPICAVRGEGYKWGNGDQLVTDQLSDEV